MGYRVYRMETMNLLINIIKVGLIWITDCINGLYDPFQEFNRTEETKYFEYLHEKEKKFNIDMEGFYWPERNVYRYKLPTDSGDQCLWHGIYTVMWALKNSVTQKHFTELHGCLGGMREFQIPHLIRGWREDGTYEDEVSADQASGYLAGIYFGWKYGDIYCRVVANSLITSLANELHRNKNQLINTNGSVTQHGKLENGHLSDPLNLTLCLVIYKVGYELTGNPIYLDDYSELCQKYRLLLPYAKVKLLWWDEQPASHRAAIHYSILCDLEKDHDLNRAYLTGLLRTWKIVKKSANPWIYFLVRRICLVDPAYIEKVKTHLREFTLEDKQYNAQRINSDQIDPINWGGHKRSRQPLPRWKVGSQDFFWQRHMYSVDDWIGNGNGNMRHNGGDFLIAYWGLRSLNLIGGQE